MLIGIGSQTFIRNPEEEKKYSLSFDGVDDTIRIPLTPSLRFGGSFTVRAKIKNIVATDSYSVLCRAGTRSGDFFTTIGLNVGLGFYGTSGTMQNYSSYNFEDDQDYDISYVYDENLSQTFLYVNRTLVSVWNVTGERPNTSSDLYVFSRSGTERFTGGLIWDLEIWSRPLSQQEIESMTNIIGNEVGLEGYWPLNEGGGTTAYDHSGNDNHGIIHGATWVEV